MTVGKLVGWNYQKKITLNNTGAELTDYQVMFTVNRSAGADTGFTVYVGTKCESDYDDIRFTKADGTTLLDYWIESADSNTAVIWVEVDTIAASGNTTIYLYYGNTGASAVSDGDATFLLFDDFPGSSLNGDKWTALQYGTTTLTVSGGVLTLTSNTYGGWCAIGSDSAFGLGTAIRCRATLPTAAGAYGLIDYNNIYAQSSSPDETDVIGKISQSVDTLYLYSKNAGTGTLVSFGSSINNQYDIYDLIRTSNSRLDGYRNADTTNSTTNIPTGDYSIYITARMAGATTTVLTDWVLVRKYTATEPTVSAWGPEDIGSFGGAGMGSANCMGIGM